MISHHLKQGKEKIYHVYIQLATLQKKLFQAMTRIPCCCNMTANFFLLNLKDDDDNITNDYTSNDAFRLCHNTVQTIHTSLPLSPVSNKSRLANTQASRDKFHISLTKGVLYDLLVFFNLNKGNFLL